MAKSQKQIGHIARLNANQKGSNNRNWKGDNVGYAGLHLWIRDNLVRPKICPKCNERETRDVANLDGNYSRDLNTWQWLCRSCHLVMDDVANKAWKTKRGIVSSV